MAAQAGSPRARAARTARGVAFAALFAWMVAGPLAVQVFRTPGALARYLRAWEMFGGRGMDVVEARFFERLPTGELRELDRFRLLGHADRHAAPPWLRLIQGNPNTRKVGLLLCEALGGRADVRIVARRGARRGWTPSFTGREPICPVRSR